MMKFDERGYLTPYTITQLEIFCKWNHRFFEEAKKRETRFNLFFGSSREDEKGKRWPKGIIKINFLP